MLTQSELKELLHYDPNTGEFRWLVANGPRAKVGAIAGTKGSNDYVMIKINHVRHLAHRLAWLYMTGTEAPKHIDHIDGDGYNNAWSNLRECTHAENHQNLTLRANNTSGYTGVNFHKPRGTWHATITKNGRTICLGYHKTPEEAHKAYLEGKAKYHTFNPIPR